jgi:hypothetical protein
MYIGKSNQNRDEVGENLKQIQRRKDRENGILVENKDRLGT